jgi:pimeloyl-ACP methyl ester carboxylesterase
MDERGSTMTRSSWEQNRMSVNGDTDGARSSPDALARLFEGIPVAEQRLDLAGVSTSLFQGGDGIPIVLLHGQGGFAAHWAQVIPRLVPTHHVVAPDLPGLGESVVQANSLDAAGVVSWLDALIEQTCAQPPILVGISLGGALAARYAVKHGDRIVQIVLVNSGSLGWALPTPGALVALMRYGIRRSEANFDRLIRYVVVDPERARAQWGDRWAALAAYDMDRTAQRSVRSADSRLLRQINVPRIPPGQLRSIGVPVALIWSRNDRITRFRIAEKASARFGWPLYPIDDCGHFAIGERPDTFVETLRTAMGARA